MLPSTVLPSLEKSLHRRRKSSLLVVYKRRVCSRLQKSHLALCLLCTVAFSLFYVLCYHSIHWGTPHTFSRTDEEARSFEFSPTNGSFSVVILLPDESHLAELSPTVCRMISLSYQLRVVLRSYKAHSRYVVELGSCRLSVELMPSSVSLAHPLDLRLFLNGKYGSFQPQLLLSCFTNPLEYFPSIHANRVLPDLNIIQLPCDHLSHAEWMGTLTPQEWRSWYLPRIELTVITNDRPKSLNRLLQSLKASMYFGDQVNLHINLEQTSDSTTRGIVDDLQWPFGAMHVRHRIIRGGLLPAIVESWYPRDNHTYGVILEDDVEVSPLFYAWLKMTILRYRYDGNPNRSPLLFGISLYQQKSLELHPSGRRPLDIPTLLSDSGIKDIHTPYLSQIPCSWGAAFFPEHWREFHDYLIFRLSELTHDISEIIVPEVRSNFWRRSWKKYFIELVYLRGYVMLYPNFPNYSSLSTNHLEAGSHVKDVSEDFFAEKKALFTVPLMPASAGQNSLLNMPSQKLPDWPQLPVMDLLGMLTSEIDIIRTGMERRIEISGCDLDNTQESPYDARDLLCGGYYEQDGTD